MQECQPLRASGLEGGEGEPEEEAAVNEGSWLGLKDVTGSLKGERAENERVKIDGGNQEPKAVLLQMVRCLSTIEILWFP